MSGLPIKVLKRNGSKEPLDIAKIHKMVGFACDGVSGVYVSQVEMNSGIQFFDGITSKEIQDILIRSAVSLITAKQPNYNIVASRLIMSSLVKEVYGSFTYPSLTVHAARSIEASVYDPEFFDYYDLIELNKLNSFIKHERDMEYAYASIRQMCDKYLVQDRSSDTVYETPQMMYMMIAATLFSNYPKETRLQYVKAYYDAISTHHISLPTPILSGVRTPTRQFSSCVLVDIGDSLDSIFSSNYAVGIYTAARAGIGLNFGRVRAIGSKIRGGEVEHTGLLPFMKMLTATTRSCTQNGVRGGNATTNVPVWHYEIEDVIVLKNNKGTEETRIRTMDYCIHFNKLFYERSIKGQDITLFSPADVPDLYEAFYTDQELFEELYCKYERSTKLRKKVVNARDFVYDFLTESKDTGRIYLMNVDHVNNRGAFLDPVYMTNLCVEIVEPTTPINHVDDTEGEIALCTLSAINLGKISKPADIEQYTDLALRAIDELLDYQEYPTASSRNHAPKRRSVGVGYIGLAHYLAKNKVGYNDPKAWELVHEISEAFQFSLIKASVQLAKEKGKCEYFDKTTYSKGILPIDNYKRDIDEFVAPVYHCDWEALRAEVLEHGMRNSCLSAQMPAESSAVACNDTNGAEPPRAIITSKLSKKGMVKQIVPGYPNLKNNYEMLWDMKTMDGYIKVIATMQKFFDQSISANLSYNPAHWPEGKIPMSVLYGDWVKCYKYGWKTRYYLNTYDESEDANLEEEEDCAACVI